MLYPTLNQGFIFLVLFCLGSLTSLIFCFAKFIKKNFLKQLFLGFSIILSFIIFEIGNLLVNYGQFRLFSYISFILGILIFKSLLNFLWTNITKKWYNSKNGKEKKEKS